MASTVIEPGAGNPEILTVSRLNDAVRALLEDAFPLVWVEGEISNLAKPRSGHVYFSLKDSTAQIRCAMFRNRGALLRFRPADGMRVVLRARVSLYSPRGDFQLIVEHMDDAGEGLLRKRFEALRDRLEREGLFAASLKRPLPSCPKRVAVVTSPTGAALRDVLHVLERRFPALSVLVYPTSVQGASAAAEIARQISTASRRNECDVLVVTRGGGSLEDLWAFNEEIVARAIADCTLPVVSAVGHETDFTIADLCADVRAPTPSAAAELISPSSAALSEHFERLFDALERGTRGRLSRHAQRLDELERRVANQHPRRRLAQNTERLRQLFARLRSVSSLHRERFRTRMTKSELRLSACNPMREVTGYRKEANSASSRLVTATRGRLAAANARLSAAALRLDSMSPLGTLERGYAVVTRCDDGSVIRDASQVDVDDELEARLADGRIRGRVTSTSR